MPVPGSLRRRPVDEKELIELLERQFEIKPIETRAYMRLLEGHDMSLHELASALGIPPAETVALMERMLSSGLVIRATGSESRFAPLHPRMTMTNIFKVYEKRVVDTLRDHRATVDRVVNLLTPIYEERKIQRGE
jgi:sugar-specific transcriptional regulator TrmB